MEITNWLKQTPDKPLFDELIWSRPETKQARGKLLIIGGNSAGFAVPAGAFAAAGEAGIGSTRVLLPQSLQKTLGKAFIEAEFAPATPSGSFGRQALAEALQAAQWANGVLLAGGFGRNSETAVFVESLVSKFTGPLCVSGDCLDYFLGKNSSLLARQNTVVVSEVSQLQKLAKSNRPTTPVFHNMSLQELVSVLSDWTNSVPTAFITKHANSYITAYSGKVSTTPVNKEQSWQTELAAYAAVWLLQNPTKPLEALSSSIYDYSV